MEPSFTLLIAKAIKRGSPLQKSCEAVVLASQHKRRWRQAVPSQTPFQKMEGEEKRINKRGRGEGKGKLLRDRGASNEKEMREKGDRRKCAKLFHHNITDSVNSSERERGTYREKIGAREYVNRSVGEARGGGGS